MSTPVGEAAQLLSRYAWAIDERRWEGLGEVFTADAVADYEAFVCHGVGELAERMRELHDELDATQHLIGSLLVEEEGSSLVVRSHVQATLVKRGHPGGPTVTVLARYDDNVRRTPAGLRIARRSVRGLSISGNRGLLPWLKDGAAHMSYAAGMRDGKGA